MATIAATIAATMSCGRPSLPRGAQRQTRPVTGTRIDLFRDNRANVQLTRQLQLKAGQQKLRIEIPGRPNRSDIKVVTSSAQILHWRPVAANANASVDAIAAVEITVVAPSARLYDVAISYAVTTTSWRVDYRIIVHPHDQHATFDATLVIDAPFGLPTGQVVLHNISAPEPNAPLAPGLNVARVVLAPGQTRLPLLSTRSMHSAPRLTVDFWADQPSLAAVTLAADPSYGGAVDRQVDAAVTYDLDFSDRAYQHAPIGSADVYLQTPGHTPVLTAQTKLFDGSVRSRTASITITHVTGVFARRRRSEFSYHAKRNRVIEQFDVDITNESDTAASVTLTDRAVRGGEWWIGYCSAAQVAKSPGTDQEFNVTVQVPAHQVRKAMYRIVYSGPQP